MYVLYVTVMLCYLYMYSLYVSAHLHNNQHNLSYRNTNCTINIKQFNINIFH